MPILLIRGEYPKFTKNLEKSTPEKTNKPIINWTKDLNRHFPKEDIQMAKRHMKRF